MESPLIDLFAWLAIIGVLGGFVVYHYSKRHRDRAWQAETEWNDAFQPSLPHVPKYPVPFGMEEIDPQPFAFGPETNNDDD
jgi:hypothetical protein